MKRHLKSKCKKALAQFIDLKMCLTTTLIEAESQSYIFKIYSCGRPESGKISFVYRKLSENNILHPRFFTFSREDENFPNGYSIEECLPGTTADRLTLSEQEKVSLFEKLAVFVSRIHKIELVNYGYIGAGKPAIWTTFSECMHDILKDNAAGLIANGFINAEELRNVNKEICARLKRCDVFPSVLCHGDLSAKNILIHSNQMILIDWDDSQSLCWMADIARLTFWMKMIYSDREAAVYRKAFLDRYETSYDKNAFYEIEDTLHVWYGLDYLTFFKNGAVCEKVKSLLRDSRNKCGI